MKTKLRLALLIGLILAAQFSAPPVTQAALDLPIYTDALASGWENWSWDASTNLDSASPVQSGSRAVTVQISAAWGALYLHNTASIDLASYDRLRFWIHGGASGGQQLRVVANGSGSGYALTAQGGQWSQVVILLSELGSPASLSDLYWQDAGGSPQPLFSLDQVELLAGSTTTPPPAPGAGPALTVNASQGRKPISPYIYGINFADAGLAQELDLPVERRGGNATTRYNWQVDAYNTGSDWYFENIPEDNPNPIQLPNGSSADRFVQRDQSIGADTILTVPLIGWVAKRRLENHPYDCGFKVSKYGAQTSTDPWDSDCGSGVNGSGDITANNPTDTSVATTAQFVKDWVTHLVGVFGSAAGGGVQFYNLDNEPMLWNSTHRDVHPAAVSYNELRDRTYQYAAAIKEADPTALTLGPVVWGWCAYLYSAADGCSPGSDYAAHANTYLVPWYLQQMKAYQDAHGVRILDYLDLHYYPQAGGVALSTAGSAATQALRLRSTRSLWDASYIDESWISDTQSGGVAVNLIERMKSWVSANYPGTKLAITEYNWGGLEAINGALTQADILGIFGREGLDLATLWAPPDPGQPGAYAFRIFRNYDGQGHKFGDTSIQAASADQAQLAVYAAQRGDLALTILVINKTANSLTSPLNLSGFIPSASAQVFRYSVANLNAIMPQPAQSVSAGGFTATYPANSLTLFVIPLGIPLDNHIYIPIVGR